METHTNPHIHGNSINSPPSMTEDAVSNSSSPLPSYQDDQSPWAGYSVDEIMSLPQLNIGGVTNSQSLHEHLFMLNEFNKIHDKTKDDLDLDMVYLCRAETRYYKFMDALNRRKPAKEDVPVPPLDVLSAWHAHILSPLRYYEDCYRLYGKHMMDYELPLAKFHAQKTGSMDTASSIQFWTDNCPGEEYEMDLATIGNSQCTLTCPYCSHVSVITWKTYSKIKVGKKTVQNCRCGVGLSADRLSARRFRDDVVKYLSRPTSIPINPHVCLAGSLVDVKTGLLSHADAETFNEKFLNEPTFRDAFVGIKATIGGAEKDSWNQIILQFSMTVRLLKAKRQWRYIPPGILRRVRASYLGIFGTPFSIDLVAAMIRQRGFTSKMCSDDCRGLDHPVLLANATIRYSKYALLMRRQQQLVEKFPLVPTLDIDLAWHTHMLHPDNYRNFCIENMGNMVINHDDTIEDKNLDKFLIDTALLWYKFYREPYTTDDLKSKYKTGGKVFGGIIFPPYGAYMLAKSRKLAKTQQKNEAPKGPPPDYSKLQEKEGWPYRLDPLPLPNTLGTRGVGPAGLQRNIGSNAYYHNTWYANPWMMWYGTPYYGGYGYTGAGAGCSAGAVCATGSNCGGGACGGGGGACGTGAGACGGGGCGGGGGGCGGGGGGGGCGGGGGGCGGGGS